MFKGLVARYKKRQAKKVIRQARTILVEEGWRTGAMGAVGYPSCLMGALRQAGTGDPHGMRFECSEKGRIILDLIQQELPSKSGLIIWNDAQRSAEPVLELLEKVSA